MWPTPFAPLFNNLGLGAIEQSAPVVVSASASSSSAATALPGGSGGDIANTTISIENTTNGWAFCNFGDGGVGAATTSNGVGVAPSSVRNINVQPSTAFVTVILSAGATSGPVRFLRGSGLD